MVMIFSSEKALKQLLTKGMVVSFRKIMPGPERKHGADWITDRRCGSKVCDVVVFGLDVPVPLCEMALEPFVEFSGFQDTDEWIEEIKTMNGGSMKSNAYGELFCVLKRGKSN